MRHSLLAPGQASSARACIKDPRWNLKHRESAIVINPATVQQRTIPTPTRLREDSPSMPGMERVAHFTDIGNMRVSLPGCSTAPARTRRWGQEFRHHLTPEFRPARAGINSPLGIASNRRQFAEGCTTNIGYEKQVAQRLTQFLRRTAGQCQLRVHHKPTKRGPDDPGRPIYRLVTIGRQFVVYLSGNRGVSTTIVDGAQPEADVPQVRDVCPRLLKSCPEVRPSAGGADL